MRFRVLYMRTLHETTQRTVAMIYIGQCRNDETKKNNAEDETESVKRQEDRRDVETSLPSLSPLASIGYSTVASYCD